MKNQQHSASYRLRWRALNIDEWREIPPAKREAFEKSKGKKNPPVRGADIPGRYFLDFYESGKRSVEQLASDLASLSPQLHVQLQCQVRLVDDVLRRGMLYFVQRDPVTLGQFKWRIDQKTSPKATFEKTFKLITPGFLQSMAAREPAISLQEEDYSYFAPYLYGASEVPEFYSEHYGKPKGDVINIGKIMRENLEFPDSQEDAGVQIADLLASGLRRCLRREFNNSEAVMADLAQLMIGNIRGKYPIQLLGFDPQEQPVERHVATCIKVMDKFSRHMLTEQP